jgi:hypothetical protein
MIQLGRQFVVVLGVLAPLTATGPALAQAVYGPGTGLTPTTTPPVSPYINLLRRGNPTFLNYYGLVRPEQRFTSAIGTLQQQTGSNQQLITDLDTALEAPVTGHRTSFLNNARYFLTQGAQATTTPIPGGVPGGGATGVGGGGRTSVYSAGAGLYTPISPPRKR